MGIGREYFYLLFCAVEVILLPMPLLKKDLTAVVSIKPTASILKGQCLFVVSGKNNKVIFSEGIKELLGYGNEEFKFSFKLIHPFERKQVLNLIEENLKTFRKKSHNKNYSFITSYRIQKKNGEYLNAIQKVILTSVDTTKSHPDALYIISALPVQDKQSAIQNTNPKHILFSKREVEIIKLLKRGSTSAKIAEQLFLSKHTVDTHRRNMLRKCKCENTVDLIEYYKQTKNNIPVNE